MTKKLSIFLLALFASAGITQAAIVDGSCGDNLTWSLNTQDSTLTITGSGEMTKWSVNSATWHDYIPYIKYVSLPDGLISIGVEAFRSCTCLTSVTIPSSVTSIGDGAFDYCTGLTSIEIPNNVTSIGYSAFRGCSGLTTVTIPSSVTSIGDGAFDYCSGLTSINVASDNSNYCSVDGVLFNKDKTTLIQYPGGKQGAYTIPNSVTSIGSGAFAHCSGLTSVTIPNSVTSIGSSAFSGCSGLTSVTIGNSVESIGSSAFGGCYGLTSVTITNSVTSIGEWAFYRCSGLTSVTIGNSVTSIGDYAFYKCRGLSSVTNYASTPQNIDSYLFDDVNISACTLYVPEESVDAYKAADVWKEFGIIEGVDVPGEDPVETIPGDYSIYYVDKESQELSDEVVTLHVPVAPVITGFTFVRWQAYADDIKYGITIQALYQADVPSSAPAVYTNPANPAQKLIRNGSVYILTDDSHTYTLTGQQVK